MNPEEFHNRINQMDSLTFVRQFLINGLCAAFDEAEHMRVRTEVAGHFGIHPNQVVVVGSARLGFSIAPQKRYKSFDDSSDIDLAIVAPNLFDDIWVEAFLYAQTGADWSDKSRFFNKLSEGWIRPDLLPRSRMSQRRGQWFDFFRSLSAETMIGRIPVKGGLYKSHFFLEHYHARSVEGCKEPQV